MFAEYGTSLGYDQGVIRGDRYNGDQHGRMSSNSLELFARGQHVAASVTFAHSLERPDVLTEREAPIYFRLDFSSNSNSSRPSTWMFASSLSLQASLLRP